jgi:hypothetical protein
MLSSRDAKLSSWAAVEPSLVVAVAVAELTLVVAVAELTVVVVATELSLVVAATELTAIVVAMTQVAAVVGAAIEVAAVAVTSLNWKIQSLRHQTQCPACTIGCDNQSSFQLSIHHSLQDIPACFYGGQVLPYRQVLKHIPLVLDEN